MALLPTGPWKDAVMPLKVIVDLQDYVGLIKKKLILEQIRSAGFLPVETSSSPGAA
jgi:hypothetical protein